MQGMLNRRHLAEKVFSESRVMSAYRWEQSLLTSSFFLFIDIAALDRL